MPHGQQRSADDGMRDAGGRARWAILWLTCGGLFGQFFAFDIPSALNDQMKSVVLSQGTKMLASEYHKYFGLLYSVYSVPNVVLPLALGIAVDRCGYRALIVLLALCVVVGQVIFTLGWEASSWSTMLLGRAVFGFGGETLQIAQNCLLFRWFKGREVALALGLNLSVARGGSVVNDVLSPFVARRWGVTGALWLGTVLCVAGFALNVWSAVMDKREGERTRLAEATSDEHVSMKDVMNMPRLYWLLTALCVVLYSAILPFNNIASGYFVETAFAEQPRAQAQQSAGNALSVLFLVSALGTPPFGGFLDMMGRRTHFLLFSSLLLTLTYAAIAHVPPVLTTFCLGCVYTAFAGALWPAFALTVPQRMLGTAYGFAVSLQNAGLAVVPVVVGWLQSRKEGAGRYQDVMRMFLSFGLAGVAVSLLVMRVNADRGGVLDKPSGEADQCAASDDEIVPLRPPTKGLPAKGKVPGAVIGRGQRCPAGPRRRRPDARHPQPAG